MTKDKNDDRNWIVVVSTISGLSIASSYQAENMALKEAERLVSEESKIAVEAVFVYERKGTVKLEKIAKWS